VDRVARFDVTARRIALEAIAARPAEAWTVESLAKVAGLSRAAFARRFVEEVGAPPLHYVTEVRMRLAAERLVRSDEALAVIAIEVGYATEFSLSRAFRRTLGDPPGVYRRRARAVSHRSLPMCLAA
jgi:transcriptional regulator GlxA family with amidase domain